MPDQEIIDGLIASYRELNHRVRGAGLTGADESSPVTQVLRRLRDRELRASQAVKRMLLGEAAEATDEAEADAVEFRGLPLSPTVLLSQFGTARESTLSMVRDLPDEEWNKRFVTPNGEMTLRDYLKSLVDRDRERMSEIDASLAKIRA
ncbi:MAG TPA: hypothetical protein VFN57_00780 [Thermomicrobiaceae bacterium]|nr:hypothetical protein [Thermomicrobiaceae bacterium]